MFRRFYKWVKGKIYGEVDNSNVVNTEPIEYNGERISVQIHTISGFNEREARRFRYAVELMLRIVNSLEFKVAVMNAPLIRTNGLKSSQVYALFMSGSDSYNTVADADIDISITLYYSNSRTIGYTYPNTFRTWINRRFFTKYGYSTIVSNLVHEYCHNLGFTHPARGYTQRNVPYFYGNVAENLTTQLIDGAQLTQLKSINS